MAREDGIICTEGLTGIPGARNYYASESGHVHRFGHPKLGAIIYPLKPTAQITHAPGSGIIRRTGRFWFPVMYDDGRLRFHEWTPPAQPTYHQYQKADDEDDDCPF